MRLEMAINQPVAFLGEGGQGCNVSQRYRMMEHDLSIANSKILIQLVHKAI